MGIFERQSYTDLWHSLPVWTVTCVSMINFLLTQLRFSVIQLCSVRIQCTCLVSHYAWNEAEMPSSNSRFGSSLNSQHSWNLFLASAKLISSEFPQSKVDDQLIPIYLGLALKFFCLGNPSVPKELEKLVNLPQRTHTFSNPHIFGFSPCIALSRGGHLARLNPNTTSPSSGSRGVNGADGTQRRIITEFIGLVSST